MVGDGEVALTGFIDLLGVDDGNGVLLTVDDTLLQSGEDLGPGHRRRVHTQGGEGVHMNLVLHAAQLQTGAVRRGLDGVLGVGHLAEAVLPERAADDADVVELGNQGLTDLAVQNPVGMIITGEQEGQVQNQEVLDKVAERTCGGDGDVQGAHLKVFDVGTLVTELGGGEDVDLYGAAGLFVDQFGKLQKAEMVRMGVCAGVGGTERDDIRRGSGGCGGSGQRQNHDEAETQREKSFHVGVPPFIIE